MRIFAGSALSGVGLLRDLHAVTDGSAAFVWRPVGPAMIKDVGGRIEGITVYATLDNISANFALKLQGQYSNDGRTWTTFAADIVGPITADGNDVSSEYTTLTDFGRHLRFQLGTSDLGAVEHCDVTVSVALRFYQGA